MSAGLQQIIAKLVAHYGHPRPPITSDPFELVLLENVAYLIMGLSLVIERQYREAS